MGYERSPAPGDLALLERFVNTARFLYDEDAFAAPAGTAAWLREQGVGVADGEAPEVHGRVRQFRELVRDHLAGTDLAATSAELTAFAAGTGAGVRWSETGRPEFAKKDHGSVDGFLISVLQILFIAGIKGELQRVKVCRNSECRYVFYDRSPARNGAWCSMDICGARHKMRAYRSRRAR